MEERVVTSVLSKKISKKNTKILRKYYILYKKIDKGKKTKWELSTE